MHYQYRWQAPGNGNAFDCDLNDWEKDGNIMSQRSIGALEYINEHIGGVDKNIFIEEIWDYLEKRFNHKKNESCISHFFRPMEFIGFIRNNDNILDLSIDGKNFINAIKNKNYDTAKDFYILQLMKVRYPNNATKEVKLKLFPFRIMFKLFIEYEHFPVKFFTRQLPYIKNYSNIENLQYLNGEMYIKWKTWIISYLIKWNILKENKQKEEVYLSEYKYDLINDIVKNMRFEDMFLENLSEEQIKIEKNNLKKRNTNSKYIKEAITINNHKCFFDENHITFPTNTTDNFLEGHHIIPVSLQKSFDEDLDVVDNIIPVCPNCHRAIHLAKDDCKLNMIKKIIEDNNKLKTFTNITFNDLKEIYCY